jgi:hypothetical protein
MIKHLHYAPRSNYNYSKIAVFARQYGLQPADRLIEPIFQTGLTKHHSIYLGIDAEGTEWIAENHKFVGVRLIKASDYFLKGKLIKTERFRGNYQQRIAAVKRALSLLGKPYNLIDFNCEHYAQYVQTGKIESKQVSTVLAVLACLFFIGILTID